MLFVALLTSNLLAIATQSAPGDLFTPPGTSTKTCEWRPFDAKLVANPVYKDSQTYQIVGSEFGINGTIEGVTVMKPPTGRRLKFSVALRGSKPKQSFAIFIIGNNPEAKTALPWTAEWEVSGDLRQDQWTLAERDIVLPVDTKYVRIVLHNPNKDAIYLSGFHLLPGEAAEPDAKAIAAAQRDIEIAAQERAKPPVSPMAPFLKAIDGIANRPGPAVAHILMRAPLCTKKPGQTAVVTFPVPTLGMGQVPLAYKVACLAPGTLIGYAWRKRDDGRNMVCDVTVKPGTKGSWVQYEALVLLASSNPVDTTPPPASTVWTQSTACVQSNVPQIRAIEQKLSAPGDSTESFARKVMAFVRDNMGKGAPFVALDAAYALECGGSCTNRANLAAALLRAHGVPARTVAHMPVWATEPLYEHWLTEYWQQGKGWVAIDATIGSWEPDRRSRVVLSTANPADENRAFEPLHERFVMPGAPYMSVAELSPDLFPADLAQDDGINSVNEIARVAVGAPVESILFESAAKAFEAWLSRPSDAPADVKRYQQVLVASTAGKLTELLATLK